MRVFTFANCDSSTAAGAMPRFPHIEVVRSGHELPAKMRVFLMVVMGRKSGKSYEFFRVVRQAFLNLLLARIEQ